MLMESSPLLGASRRRTEVAESNEKLLKNEMRKIARDSLPVFVSHILEFSLVIVEVVSVGHISTSALAAASLGSMTANVTGSCILYGLTSALDTILPSAFTSGQPHLVGLWTQRMSVVILIALLPISAIWMNAEMLLLHLKQDPEIARLAGLYLRYMILGLPAYGFNCISRKFFQSQGLFSIQTQINLFVAPVNLLVNYILVWGPPSTRIGFIGAPIATSISYILVSIISIIYGIYSTPRTTWHPLSLQMFSNLSILFRLGLAGVAQIASEWWAWELLALAASFINPLSLASQSILVTSSATTFQALNAMSNAASIRIGNLLGEKNAKLASIATTASILVALIVSSMLSAMYMIFRGVWAQMFSDDPNVVALVASVLPLIAFYQILDGVSAVTSGILRAKGRQDIGALLNFGSYYIIGLPLGIWLTFGWKMGLHGLWIGMAVALLCCAVVGTTICLRTDWEVEVLKATERLEEDCSQSRRMDGHT